MLTRRRLLKSAAATGFVTGASGLAMPALAQGAPIRIGYVSPQTGPLAGFAEADAFTIEAFNRIAADQGWNIEVIVKDSQSNPNRAADVAQEAIIDDGIHLMLVASTPETTNPVTTVAESEGIPTISTMAPWQPWFIGQQGNPGDPGSWRPFDYSYHYFWGLEDVIAVFTNMWDQLDTNKVVAGLFPNDADGNAWGDPNTGVAPGFAEDGYETVDPGRYQNLTDDFTAQINAFKQANADIVTGVVIPPDFTTFRNQASQQGFNPKAITVAKAILFPQSVETLGEAGHNLSSEVWWSANHPFTSSLTGQSSSELAAAFTEATGRPWTQPIGFIHSLFEVAADVIQRTEDPTDPDGLAEAIAATNLDTIVGHVEWNGEGVPDFAAQNVCKTPLVGGQWRRQDDGSFELVVVDNQTAPQIPTQGEMQPLS
ncbi:ABC transporter substrate-binding protein [Histidinibacterium aquaticum]|uniref:ABC transporter substrate-binding protein n=1 Tax=Histidinibacterium aquaticum TaxID=2613962 RepID=A0A5J5GC75_9RHOB|nr:ABC transporter substrate-binding protein [Histidinibacterium aquaticum]KAA9005558.1 ABC transporter substrate-binding protein [Histidinibacterium aquaticum]